MNDLFLDTSYAIALSSSQDLYHQIALVIAEKIEAEKTRIITTHPILLEIGNALCKQRYRNAAVTLIESLIADPMIEIIEVSDQLFKRALALYRERPDKEWSLTDCVSFVVMNDRHIVSALTTDDHFHQAGFRPLMREIQP